MPLSDDLLRSVIRFGPLDAEETLQDNLQAALREWHGQIGALGVDGPILTFLATLAGKTAALPEYTLVHRHFREAADTGDGVAMASATRLELLAASPPALLDPTAFRYGLDQFREALLGQGLQGALLQTSTILVSGVDQPVSKNGQRIVVRLQGPQDALTYLSNELNTLLQRTGTGPAEGRLGADASAVLALYEMRRDNPLKTGVLSGLREIDSVHHGLRPGELALVLGFVGHMKSTFCLAWLYKAAVFQGLSGAVVSCEIPIEDLRWMLYLMHANHPKFAADVDFQSLSVTALTYGGLTASQERFFRAVIDDFQTCPGYGRIHYRDPSINMTIADIQRWAEGIHRRTPLDLLLIDYLGLLDPGKGTVGSNETTGGRLNAVIRQTKLLAMGFGAGRGIPILSPFQANREGWKEAEKSGGRYKLTALSWANEAERSADLIYYVFLDELLRQSRELAVGNLKTRMVPLIADQFRVYADPVARVIENLDLSSPMQAPVSLA